ncbi:MAG: DUF1097 domain-containing protein [Halobacteriales archaeon]
MTREPPDASETLSLAVVFGLVSVPWTYAFVAELSLPLWPSFIAAATFYAAGGGLEGWRTGLAGNLAGIFYAAVTIGLVEGTLSGGVLALSLVVGGFMFLASLHPFVPPLAFAPAAFFGFATLFGVHAGGEVAVLAGLSGEVLAAAFAMVIGSAIGYGTENLSNRMARSPAVPIGS